MLIAQFIFTKYQNYFSVKIPNLEKLEINHIKSIQKFVQDRNGVFNFDTYTFEIQKRLEFNEFQILINNLNLNATCKENQIQQIQQDRISFGQYKGLFYSELPNSYMVWLKTNYRGFDKEKVDKELLKRGL